MAAAYIVFRNSDPSFAQTLLRHSKKVHALVFYITEMTANMWNVLLQLFEFADKFQVMYHESVPQVANFYRSYSGFDVISFKQRLIERKLYDV